MSANDEIQDDFIQKQVDLERVSAGSKKRVAGILNKMEKRIIALLASADIKSNGQLLKGALDDLFDELTKIVGQTYTNQVKSIIEKDLKNVSRASRMQAEKSINNTAGTELVTTSTSAQTAQKDLNAVNIEGVDIDASVDRQAGATAQRYIDRINRGVSEGLGIDDIVRSVRGTAANNYKDGLIQISKNDATRLIRTSVNKISNDSALKAFQDNLDVVEFIEQISTLDSRTSDICKAYDSRLWNAKTLEPVGHSLPYRGGPPRHWNCRSVIVPVTKSLESLGISTRKKNVVADNTEGTRKAFDGEVPESTTYEEWLGRQSQATQIEALGRTKWELWKDGKLNFRQLVDQSGNPLSTEALIERYS